MMRYQNRPSQRPCNQATGARDRAGANELGTLRSYEMVHQRPPSLAAGTLTCKAADYESPVLILPGRIRSPAFLQGKKKIYSLHAFLLATVGAQQEAECVPVSLNSSCAEAERQDV